MRSRSMDKNGGRRHHTAAMGPHPRQQSTQQSTNIICDGSTSLKLEKTIFINSNITNNARRVDVDERRRRCSNGTMGAVQPTGQFRQFRRHVTAPLDISDRGQLGGTGCGRCGPRYLVPTGGIHKVTHVFFV
jgi:hypothetical protein